MRWSATGRAVVVCAMAAATVSCDLASNESGDRPLPDTAGTPAARPLDTPSPRARLEAVEEIVAFLQERAPLDPALLGDSVTLRVAPEGGGATRRASRRELGDRSAWRVGGFDLVPPPSLTELTTAPGRHLSCVDAALVTRAPELASRPHVGAILRPPQAQSCLQSWTLTFVFADSAPPTITDVLYDQWEW